MPRQYLFRGARGWALREATIPQPPYDAEKLSTTSVSSWKRKRKYWAGQVEIQRQLAVPGSCGLKERTKRHLHKCVQPSLWKPPPKNIRLTWANYSRARVAWRAADRTE